MILYEKLLYDNSKTLWEELDKINIIKRLSEIPQLGDLEQNNKEITKLKYIENQVYLHSLCQEFLKEHSLKLSYHHPMVIDVYGEIKSVSIGDAVRILIILSSIGHFYSTFTGSKTLVSILNKDKKRRNQILEMLENDEFKKIFKEMIQRNNYFQINYLNSLLILQKCNQNKEVIKLAKAILLLYLTPNYNFQQEKEKEEWNYCFSLFKTLRDLSFVITDLPQSKVPFSFDTINLENYNNKEKNVKNLYLCEELLAEYNDESYSNNLLEILKKLLNDTVYNLEKDVILQRYKISEIIKILKKQDFSNYYKDLFINENSVLNNYLMKQKIEIDDCILKLTFKKNDKYKDAVKKGISEFTEIKKSKLLQNKLSTIKGVKVACYDRHKTEKTLLIALEKNYPNKTKLSFQVMGFVVKYLNEMQVASTDCKYLLSLKFFLYYLCGEQKIIVEPFLEKYIVNKEDLFYDKKTFCYCYYNEEKDTEGHIYNYCVTPVFNIKDKKRVISYIVDFIENIEPKSSQDLDRFNEIYFLRAVLFKEKLSEFAIIVTANVLVRGHKKKDAEFDGFIIFPFAKKEQIIFLEAKNTIGNIGEKCLEDRLKKLSIPEKLNFQLDKKDFIRIENNYYYKVTI